jgi:hypothetical protein
MDLADKKIVIIINGKGSSGKDTVCSIVGEVYKASSVSEITPIKEIAKLGGWNGEKDMKARRMLADLKQVFVEYNDLPFRYAMRQIEEFKGNGDNFLFIHIREPQEIDKVVKNADLPVFTLLIVRTDDERIKQAYGNDADDNVDNYEYSFRYVGNNKNVEELKVSFMAFFREQMLPVMLKQNLRRIK